LVALTRLFLPGFIKKDFGGVMNVGSLAGFQPGPNAAIYYATKAFVLSFTEALATELKKTNVKVSCLAPGPVETGFGEVSGMNKALLFKYSVMNVNDVVNTAYTEFMEGKTLIIPGLLTKFLPQLSRVFPRKLVREIAGKLNTV
ncbi:MAG: SDR family NAD(P)-dependent oxidoreductase, partial [Thermodesulfobacteriota bacterium]